MLRRLDARSLVYCLWLMVGIGVCFSTDPLSSLLHAGTGINKGFILPFIAMECVRGEKDLRRLVWACVLACFWQGLDGVWQVFTGRDFIMGYELNAGRLTGSLGDYTVGNYIALALIPAFGLWFILRRGLDAVSSVFLCLTVFWPAFFLLLGAASRSGALAVAYTALASGGSGRVHPLPAATPDAGNTGLRRALEPLGTGLARFSGAPLVRRRRRAVQCGLPCPGPFSGQGRYHHQPSA